MQVKDVEKLTGLSTKAIRLYEEKGLIEVARNPLNDYRDYSEENVRQLRLIKLLRYFEFSLAEITALLSLPEEDLQSSLVDSDWSYLPRRWDCLLCPCRLVDRKIFPTKRLALL
ncbi:MerR family transcriptional regulator [Streptococcus suis]|nr:MerR family transcriptional regulator [Streptococcus suis]